MLVPLFHKLDSLSISASLTSSSETVSPHRNSDRLRAFIQEAGLSSKQTYQNFPFIAKEIANLRGIEPLAWRSYPSAPTRGWGFPETQ